MAHPGQAVGPSAEDTTWSVVRTFSLHQLAHRFGVALPELAVARRREEQAVCPALAALRRNHVRVGDDLRQLVSPDLGGRGYLTNRSVAKPLAKLREIQTPRHDVLVERFDMAVFFRRILQWNVEDDGVHSQVSE
jgi:hypothetical protein